MQRLLYWTCEYFERVNNPLNRRPKKNHINNFSNKNQDARRVGRVEVFSFFFFHSFYADYIRDYLLFFPSFIKNLFWFVLYLQQNLLLLVLVFFSWITAFLLQVQRRFFSHSLSFFFSLSLSLCLSICLSLSLSLCLLLLTFITSVGHIGSIYCLFWVFLFCFFFLSVVAMYNRLQFSIMPGSLLDKLNPWRLGVVDDKQ